MLFGRKKKNPVKIADKEISEWKYTTCGYYSTGCSIEVGVNKQGRAVSYYEQITKLGKTVINWNRLLASNIAIVGLLFMSHSDSLLALGIWPLLALSVLVSALISRCLFYVLVVPATMPGTFFWKNKGFEEHARESGLANMSQVGVIPDAH